MKLLGPLLLLLVQAALLLSITLVSTVSAHSQRPRPLNRYSHVSDVQLEIIERQESLSSQLTSRSSSSGSPNSTPQRRSPTSVVATDSLRISLRAFEQQFHLHLQPNTALLHPDGATIKYHALNETTGESYVWKTEKLTSDGIRAYHGVVVHSSRSYRRLQEDRAGLQRNIYDDNDEGVVGKASIFLHDDGSVSGVPKLEGSFDWLGNQHTIVTSTNYNTKRVGADPAVERRHLEADALIVHRDSDIMTEREALEAGLDSIEVPAAKLGCSSDALHHNNASHLILSDSDNDESSFSAFAFFARPTPPRLVRRDLFDGVAGMFSRSMSEELVGRPEDPLRRYMYDSAFGGDYMEPSFRRRQSTGNDIGNSGDQTDSFESTIGSRSGCPSSPRVVYIGVASDCTYTQRLGGEDSVRTEILNNMNSASNLYRSTFNISLGVVEMDVRSGNCPSSSSSQPAWNTACGGVTIDERLSVFSQWRGQQPSNGVGLWHLMTACNSGTEIGVAWLGTLCMADASSDGSQYVSGTGVSSITSQQWQVMAHEMGHNFGAIHDCTAGCTLMSNYATAQGGAACCPLSTSTCDAGAEFIMNPSSRSDITSFSQCSIGNVCSLLGRSLNTSCVETPGQRTTLSTQQCGNGILEPGEECDAGPNGSACCTAQCRLTSGSQCDPETSSCCTSSCQFAPATQVCRPALDARCDTAEMCTGNSSSCPTDVTRDNGSSCGDGLSCANGLCTSRDLQCQQASTGSMAFSKACSASNANSCQLTCQDPSSSRRCFILQQTFVDGTSCGNGGRCEGGDCKSGSWQDTFKGWYENNLQIAIPVTIVVAIIVLLLLVWIARCCLARARGGKAHGQKKSWATAAATATPFVTPRRQTNDTGTSVNGYAAPPPPVPPTRYGSMTSPAASSATNQGWRASRSHSHSDWVDPSAWNGAPPPSFNGMRAPQPAYAPPSGPPPPNGYYDSYGGRGR